MFYNKGNNLQISLKLSNFTITGDLEAISNDGMYNFFYLIAP
jgi:hypothetical protein